MQETFSIISVLDTTAAESLRWKGTLLWTLCFMFDQMSALIMAEYLHSCACVTLYITSFMPMVNYSYFFQKPNHCI